MKPLSLFVLAALTTMQGLPSASRLQGSSNELGRPKERSSWNRSAGQAAPSSLGSVKAVLSEEISVRAKGRGNPWINLADGHDLVTAYAGDAKVVSEFEAGGTRPLSLASADIDEDGVPDLLTGFAANGGGIVAVYPGNVDAIYPNSREARARKSEGTFTDAPFLSPARLLQVPSPPDFIETGDFDADGHIDVALATRGGHAIYIMPGDGLGGLGPAKAIELPGSITAMASGDVNRADGLTDIVVGIAGGDGPKLLVFEGPEGTIRSDPEVFSLPREATNIAIGNLHDPTYADIAVAAGPLILVVRGRDRKLTLDEAARAAVPEAKISRLKLASAAKSIAIGNFTGDQASQAAVLLESGLIEVVGENQAQGSRLKGWSIGMRSTGSGPGQSRLVRARLSGHAGDDLILVDELGKRLRIAMGAESPVGAGAPFAAPVGEDASIDLDVGGDPVAALAMRLNTDALSDLVLLRKGAASPSVITTQFANVFTVTTSADTTCSGGSCSGATSGSLRDCINFANVAGGNSQIKFNIPGIGVPTITLTQGPLPQLGPCTNCIGARATPGNQTQAASISITIDGPTQAAGRVEINGSNLAAAGLATTGSSNVISGVVINSCGNGVVLDGSLQGGANIIEGNFVGTDSSGKNVRPNAGRGILINGSSRNTIGGTVNSAINVISGNTGNGIELSGSGAAGNLVLLNIIGLDQGQKFLLRNGQNGVSISSGASGNTIGGAATGFLNVIAGSALDGVAISSGVANLIQSNQIQQNNGNGVSVLSPTNTVGGNPMAGITNGVWLNGGNGVLVSGPGATADIVQGNVIGVTFSNGIATAFANALSGVSIENGASHNSIGGTPTVSGNDIDFNHGDGVAVVSGTGNAILTNRIAGNTGLAIHLFPGANDNQQPPLITSAKVSGAAVNSVRPASLTMVISFTFHDKPNQTFTLQFFVPQICNCTAANCLTNITVYTKQITTDSNGDAPSPVNIDLTTAPPPNSFVNATATNANNSTSQYSECVQIGTSACVYNLPVSASQMLAGSGDSGSFTVTTTSNCNWTPSPSAAWITITSGSGPGNGVVNYTVAANPAANSRQGVITIVQGVTFTVNQAGMSTTPDFTLSFDPSSIPASPGTKIPITVNINRTGGFTGAVMITPPDPAMGIKPKPPGQSDPIVDSSYTLKLKISGGAPLVPHELTFTGTDSSGRMRSTTLTVNVQ